MTRPVASAGAAAKGMGVWEESADGGVGLASGRVGSVPSVSAEAVPLADIARLETRSPEDGNTTEGAS